MSFIDVVGSLFVARSQQLCWLRIPDDHVGRGYLAEPIKRDEAYVVLRMREMSLGYARKLWRKYYPVLHGFTQHAGHEEHQLIGPGQLKDLSESNLDRVINLNQRLAGPIPYDGGDLSLVVGLYSVPAGDAAKALIKTVGDITAAAGLAVGQLPQLAQAVKTGVESIFQLNDCRLQLGVRDTLPCGKPLTTGVYVGIAAPRDRFRDFELWLNQGRLVKGQDPISGLPYTDHDYMVIEVERRTTREDWATLPGIASFDNKFGDVMRSSASPQAKRAQLRTLWPEFEQALANSRDLTSPDRRRIQSAVANDLLGRLRLIETGNPFETRSIAHEPRRIVANDFDFLDVDTSHSADVARLTPFA
ncbi:hypothetical protein KRR26_35860 [Corallococcus sp. M34]|uniref:hypothetical protein n=1 Tax=Citreicoccus inhibens TaxID=2849499 RepID=UPI001C224360|nr:hypothetical protein [Citreicoccus inhibens]MBU8900985.1 hypothetical protein [Citreicoccus inhibens]